MFKPFGESDEIADGKRDIAEHVILQNDRDVDGAVHDLEVAADFGVAGAPAAEGWLMVATTGTRPSIFIQHVTEQIVLLPVGQQMALGCVG